MQTTPEININTGRFVVFVSRKNEDVDVVEVTTKKDISGFEPMRQANMLLTQAKYPMDTVVAATAFPMINTEEENA